MTTPLRISIPHELGRMEARRRIEGGFSRFVGQLPGGGRVVDQRWDGDRLAFRIAAMGQNVAGGIEVLASSVTIDIELPGLLGTIARAFKGRLQKAGQLLLTRK